MSFFNNHLIDETGLDNDTQAFRTRVLADGGSIVNISYVDRFIRKCKELGIWTSLKSAPDINFGVKMSGESIIKAYCIKGLDYSGSTAVANNVSGGKNMLEMVNHDFKSASPLGIAGGLPRHFINIFRHTIAENKNIAGYGLSNSGAAWDMLTYNGTVILHAVGTGFDNIGSAPPYTLGALSVYEISYNNPVVKSSINGGTAYTKNIPNILTADSVINVGKGVFASYHGYRGQAQPPFAWNAELPADKLASFISFIKTEYSIV